MQIHELNNRKKVDEADLVGPNSVFNVGKQVLKNPKAMWNSSALGASQQAANQTHSATSANKLAAQGYKVGGGIKPTVTTAQQLQVVKANPAVQQQVKNLSSQWMTQSQSLKKASAATSKTASTTSNPTPVSEASALMDPRDITDPKYASIFKALQQQSGASATTTPTQTQSAEVELEKKLTVWKEQFKQWSDSRLQTNGVGVDNVRTDSVTAKMLDSAMTNVAVAAQAGDANIEQKAVEEYFNIAIAAIQAYINNRQQSTVSRTAAAAGPAAPQNDNDILAQLQQQGVPVSKASIESLGKAMIASNGGNNAVRDTGNPILNAIARLAGMKVTT